jgi:hypothetical protein
MGLFKKVGNWFKKKGKAIGKGALKVASVGASFIPGVGNFASTGLNKLANSINTNPANQLGGIAQNPNPAVGGLSSFQNSALGGIKVSLPKIETLPSEPAKSQVKEEEKKPIPDAVKWAGIGIAAKFLLGI